MDGWEIYVARRLVRRFCHDFREPRVSGWLDKGSTTVHALAYAALRFLEYSLAPMAHGAHNDRHDVLLPVHLAPTDGRHKKKGAPPDHAPLQGLPRPISKAQRETALPMECVQRLCGLLIPLPVGAEEW